MRVVHQPGDATTGADDRDGEGKVRRGSDDVVRTGQSNSRDGSLASHPRLAARLRALCSALERPAGAHPNNLSIARWHATNDTKLPYVAELVRTRGKHFTKFGHVCGARTYLLPEEVLFLVETERLAVVAPRKKGKGGGDEGKDAATKGAATRDEICCFGGRGAARAAIPRWGASARRERELDLPAPARLGSGRTNEHFVAPGALPSVRSPRSPRRVLPRAPAGARPGRRARVSALDVRDRTRARSREGGRDPPVASLEWRDD
mgnify:CR=1 FL=1